MFFDMIRRHTNHPPGYAAPAFKVYVANYSPFHPLTAANHRMTTSGLKRRDKKSTQKDFRIWTTFEPLSAGTANYKTTAITKLVYLPLPPISFLPLSKQSIRNINLKNTQHKTQYNPNHFAHFNLAPVNLITLTWLDN